MKKYLLITVCFSLLLAGCNKSGLPDLEEGFTNPPGAARTGVYWYFMDGNLSAKGITKDLEAMKRAGVGHVLFLEVNVGVPRGQVDFLSEAWQDLFGHAARECERLGIRMALGVGPGWNGSGGPWVEADQSMQHLVYSSVEVAGGEGNQLLVLPKPAPKPPFFGEDAFPPELKKRWEGFYEDVALLAFPAGATQIDALPVSGTEYLEIPEIDERALYYRKPYSSVEGVPQYIPLLESFAAKAGDRAVDESQIIDLTGMMEADGKLVWEVPEGKWVIMRFGARNNGAITRPAPVPGLGFETDKLDTNAMQAHLDNFTEKLFKHIGFRKANPKGGIQSLHIDSWEMGAQNWTRHLREEFTRRRGYNPLFFFPVYAGVMVQSREESERFLWDLRQTVQELIAENHVAFVRRYAQRYGLSVSIEPYDMNPVADMELAAAADMPMAEFWSQGEWFRGAFNTSWSAAEASSVAHLIGQPVVPAESFTSAFDGWRQHPASVKNQGDWAFAAGINRVMYHTFQHQALPDSLRPGMTMGIYGVHWDRNQTWWYLSDAYHRYMARCQYLLQQGRTVADVLYLAPESAPHVFRAPASAYDGRPEFPDRKGYSFDACPPSLLYQASVEDGCVVFPSGATYRLLALPYWETMTPALLKKITELVRDGATVVGLPPVKSPSLSGYPACDEEVLALSKELWGVENGKDVVTKPYGKGQIIFGETLKVNADNLYPPYDFTAGIVAGTTPPDFETAGQVRYTHRTTGDCEIYFVANRDDAVQQTEGIFRVSGLQPELWDPNTGERLPLPEFTEKNGRITIPLQFEPYQSYFVVFKNGKHLVSERARNFPQYKPLMTLEKPWEVAFDPKWGGPGKTVFEQLSDWSLNSDPGIRYYSGTAFYKQSFDWSDTGKKLLYLDLGKVKNMARVTLNGKDLGTVWTSPWRVDISSAVKAGQNKLSIEVVNLWPNRLIGDEQLPDDGSVKRYTYTTFKHYEKESPLLESGLIGPVTIGEKAW